MENIGNVNSTSLPLQHLPSKRKGAKWIKDNLDTLERIGLNQRARNSKFIDNYRMLEGEIDYNDIEGGVTKDIRELRDEVGLSNDIIHFDFVSKILNQIKGEGLRNRPEMRVDTIDNVSRGEYIRERGHKFRGMVKEQFDNYLDMILVQEGIELKDDFESEEERQQYLEYLQKKKDEIVKPSEIEAEMSKSFDTAGALWGRAVLERDDKDFSMERLYAKELESKFTTGRWFRHYFMGYDYYKPEYWDPVEVFIDEDQHIEHPQYGEYVGRVTEMTPTAVNNRFGSRLSSNDQVRLSKIYSLDTEYGGLNYPGTSSNGEGFLSNIVKGKTYSVPHEGFFEDETRKQIEKTFDIPMGERIYADENNNEVIIPTYLGGRGIDKGRPIRTDIRPRMDTLRVTEAYWRSYEPVGLVTYTDEDGEVQTVLQKGELLEEFLQDYGISKLRNISLEEVLAKGTETDTIVYGWMPVNYGGVKINLATYAGGEPENIYLGGKPLDLQLKENSDMYNTILPVVGQVGKCPIDKMRPYIMIHNIALNQVISLLEKETGMFLIFDFQYLPSEFKQSGDMVDQLGILYESIKEIGIVPIDTSKQNLQGTNPQMNTLSTQSLDFTQLIQNRIALAQNAESLALQQFGITPQRLGATQTGITAEGIRAGVEASYSQTEDFFSEMDVAQSKATVVHLHVAQTCQKLGKDYKNYYLRSNGDKAYLAVNDENLPLRMFDVHVINSPKHKKDIAELKNAIINTNTLGSDVQLLAEMVLAKSVTEIKDVGERANKRNQENAEAERQHRERLNSENIEATNMNLQAARDLEITLGNNDNQTKIDVALIQAQGRMGNSGETDSALYDRVEKNRDIAVRTQDMKLKDSIARERSEIERDRLSETKRANREKERLAERNINERTRNRASRLIEKTI